MKNIIKLNILIIILILAMFMDFLMISMEKHLGVYRNDLQEYNLYNQQNDKK